MLRLTKEHQQGQWLYASPQVYLGSGCMPAPVKFRTKDVCQIMTEIQLELMDSGCMPVLVGVQPVAVCQGSMVRLGFPPPSFPKGFFSLFPYTYILILFLLILFNYMYA